MPRAGEIGVDRRVFGFTALISVSTGILFGLLPVLQVSKANLHGALKEGGRGPSGGSNRQTRLRGVLVVTEVAKALILLIGLLLKGRRGAQETGDTGRPKGQTTRGLGEAQVRVLPEPVPSVTEHTTRTSEPIYSERKPTSSGAT
jgi:putative ABC transport system permease protein